MIVASSNKGDHNKMSRALFAFLLIAFAVDAHGETFHQSVGQRELTTGTARVIDGGLGRRTWVIGEHAGTFDKPSQLRKRGRRITFDSGVGPSLECVTVRGTRQTQTGTVQSTEGDGTTRERDRFALLAVDVDCVDTGPGLYTDSRADYTLTVRAQ
jgi:hypothetical protein